MEVYSFANLQPFYVNIEQGTWKLMKKGPVWLRVKLTFVFSSLAWDWSENSIVMKWKQKQRERG